MTLKEAVDSTESVTKDFEYDLYVNGKVNNSEYDYDSFVKSCGKYLQNECEKVAVEMDNSYSYLNFYVKA